MGALTHYLLIKRAFTHFVDRGPLSAPASEAGGLSSPLFQLHGGGFFLWSRALSLPAEKSTTATPSFTPSARDVIKDLVLPLLLQRRFFPTHILSFTPLPLLSFFFFCGQSTRKDGPFLSFNLSSSFPLRSRVRAPTLSFPLSSQRREREPSPPPQPTLLPLSTKMISSFFFFW